MKLESRYIVFKQSDAAKYLTSTAIREINDSLSLIFKGREADGKVGFPNYLVLEEDWPEYPIAKEALEGRIVLEEFNKRQRRNVGLRLQKITISSTSLPNYSGVFLHSVQGGTTT